MKKLILSLLLCSGAFAQYNVGVEPIYWKPCASFYHYGARFPSTNPLITKQLFLNPDYDWGVRVFGTYECNCYFVMLDWTYLKPTSSVTSNDPDLSIFPFANNNVIAQRRITASLDHRYNKVNLRVGRTVCGNFYAYLGGRWVEIKEKREATTVPVGANQSLHFLERASFDGGGIEVGVGGEARVWCWFGLAGRLGVAGLMGTKSGGAEGPVLSANQNRTLGTQIDPSGTACTLAVEGRASVYGETKCGCVSFRGEFGYELDYYFHALRFRKPQISPNDLFASDIGFGGIFISLQVGF